MPRAACCTGSSSPSNHAPLVANAEVVGPLPFGGGERGLRSLGQVQPLVGGAVAGDVPALGVMGDPDRRRHRLQDRLQLRRAPLGLAAGLVQGLLHPFALGDVQRLGKNGRQPALAVVNGGVVPLAVQGGAVFAVVAIDVLVARALAGQHVRHQPAGALHVFLVDPGQFGDGQAQHLGCGPAEQAPGGLRPADDAELAVELDHRQRRVVQVGRQALVGLGQGLSGPRALGLGDVLRRVPIIHVNPHPPSSAGPPMPPRRRRRATGLEHPRHLGPNLKGHYATASQSLPIKSLGDRVWPRPQPRRRRFQRPAPQNYGVGYEQLLRGCEKTSQPRRSAVEPRNHGPTEIRW
jgi:hypothetical protein